MKKRFRYFPSRKIALILILFLMIMLTMKQGYCYDYQVEDTTYQVTDFESYRDFIYFTEIKGNYDNFMCSQDGVWWYCYPLGNDNRYPFMIDSPYNPGVGWLVFNGTSDNTPSTSEIKVYKYRNDGTDYRTSNEQNVDIPNKNNTYYSSINIHIRNSNDIGIQSNFTFDDIECKYNTTECSSYTPPSPEPEELTKEDFYKMGWVGITTLCVLIFMLFFKWCFPMKGGKK